MPNDLPRNGAHGLESVASGGGLDVVRLPDGSQPTLGVFGEADMSTAPRLRNQLSRALVSRPRSLVVDLSGLRFCDLIGLDALNDAAAAADAAGISLTFRGMPRQLDWLHGRFPRVADKRFAYSRPKQA